MEDGDEKWECVVPFWIDTDGYSDRDREMFVCGIEFQMLLADLGSGDEIRRPIHRENESRVRMLCGKVKRRCKITAHSGYDGCETWSDLFIEAK